MSWVTLAAVYFTVWWTVLFAVLPFGVRTPEEREVGTDPGAPARPLLLKKFLWTSLISAVLVGAFYMVFATGLLSWQDIFDPPGNNPLHGTR